MLFALIAAVFFALPQLSHAADMSLTPATGSVAVGDTFSVEVDIAPGSDSVNAADGTITFDPTLLSVSKLSQDGSVFSLWTANPSYSNSAGTVTFSGGTPTAFSSSGKILTIEFTGQAAGAASLAFSKGSILAADGKGTDVYKNGNGATLTVTPAAAADTSTQDTSSTDTSSANDGSGDAPPLAPVITSSTFSKPGTWYATSTAVFNWQITPDITAVRTLWSTNGSTTPKTTLKGGATTTQTVTGITDGVSYFYVQLKNSAGWGDVGEMQVEVDTAPPEAFSVALQQPGTSGGLPLLAFTTDDKLSGMDHYEIILGTSTPVVVNASDVTNGTYAVPPNPGGAQVVTIRAFDKAGNSQEASSTLTLPAVAAPKAASDTTDTSTTPAPSGFGLAGFIAVFLALLAGGVIAWNMYSRKTVAREKEKLLAAVLEVRDKNDRIFSAMREEFEQMINNFDEKPQLSPEERALLEGIKEVLDISEELVDTSIEDLKKMIRNQ